MTPVLVRPARDVDAADLAILAALDSAAPLTGESLIAVSGGEVAAAMSLDTGAVDRQPVRADRPPGRAARAPPPAPSRPAACAPPALRCAPSGRSPLAA